MSNNKRQNKKFIENLEATEGEIYNALIELGWLLPRNEKEMIRADKALEGIECLTFPAELENPAPLIERLRKEEYQNLSIELMPEADMPSPIKPYLGFMSDETGLQPSKIAQAVNSTREFLIQVTQNSNAVEDSVREEICDRTVRKFPQVNRDKIRRSLGQRSRKIAAARNTEYSNVEITFEHILTSSGLTEEEQIYWRNVAKGGDR